MSNLSNFFETLPDGWTIYLWLIIGAMIIVAVLYWIRWGAQNEQFDEDIKYVIFDEQDRDKSRKRHLAEAAEKHNLGI
jgi:p-aminobenzoyl-glutamate transporter AbgT